VVIGAIRIIGFVEIYQNGIAMRNAQVEIAAAAVAFFSGSLVEKRDKKIVFISFAFYKLLILIDIEFAFHSVNGKIGFPVFNINRQPVGGGLHPEGFESGRAYKSCPNMIFRVDFVKVETFESVEVHWFQRTLRRIVKFGIEGVLPCFYFRNIMGPLFWLLCVMLIQKYIKINENKYSSNSFKSISA